MNTWYNEWIQKVLEFGMRVCIEIMRANDCGWYKKYLRSSTSSISFLYPPDWKTTWKVFYFVLESYFPLDTSIAILYVSICSRYVLSRSKIDVFFSDAWSSVQWSTQLERVRWQHFKRVWYSRRYHQRWRYRTCKSFASIAKSMASRQRSFRKWIGGSSKTESLTTYQTLEQDYVLWSNTYPDNKWYLSVYLTRCSRDFLS